MHKRTGPERISHSFLWARGPRVRTLFAAMAMERNDSGTLSYRKPVGLRTTVRSLGFPACFTKGKRKLSFDMRTCRSQTYFPESSLRFASSGNFTLKWRWDPSASKLIIDFWKGLRYAFFLSGDVRRKHEACAKQPLSRSIATPHVRHEVARVALGRAGSQQGTQERRGEERTAREFGSLRGSAVPQPRG